MSTTPKTTKAKEPDPKTREKTEKIEAAPAPLTEERVREIVKETMSSSMKDLSESMEKTLRKVVEDAVKKSGKAIEESVGASVDGKLQNQTNLTKNVQKNTTELKTALRDLQEGLRSGGNSDERRFGDLKAAVDSVATRIGALEKAIQDRNPDETPVDAEGVAEAAASLARMSKTIEEMSSSVVEIAGVGPDTVARLQESANEIKESAKQFEFCVELVADKDGRLGRLKQTIDELSNQAAKACSDVGERLRQAEGALASRQTELEALVRQMNDLLSAPRTFQDEVVVRMEKILATLAESVGGLAGGLEDVRKRLDGIGNLSEFREKALLSVSFAEAAKRLQSAFEQSMSQVGASPS